MSVPVDRYYIRPHGDRFALCDKQLHDAAVYIGTYDACARRRLLVSLEQRERMAQTRLEEATRARRGRSTRRLAVVQPGGSDVG